MESEKKPGTFKPDAPPLKPSKRQRNLFSLKRSKRKRNLKRTLKVLNALAYCSKVDTPAGRKRGGKAVDLIKASISSLVPPELDPKEEATERNFEKDKQRN